MTVKELIEQLQKFDWDCEVYARAYAVKGKCWLDDDKIEVRWTRYVDFTWYADEDNPENKEYVLLETRFYLWDNLTWNEFID